MPAACGPMASLVRGGTRCWQKVTVSLNRGWETNIIAAKGGECQDMQRAIRLFFAVVGFVGGFYLFSSLDGLVREFLLPSLPSWGRMALLTTSVLAGGVLGAVLGPLALRLAWQAATWCQARLARIPTFDILAGAAGLIVGLVIAYLLRPALQPLPLVGSYLPGAVSLLLGYLGWVVALHKREEMVSLLSALSSVGRERPTERVGDDRELRGSKILDTSAIIDGRVADVARAGFLDGTLVVPGFVLDELRRIADSADPVKRSRGRRGLDLLKRMQQEGGAAVCILDREGERGDGGEVDVRLVRLAQRLDGKIVTNDFNLNKVASLHGVGVLNVNELANALRPVFLPGEEMSVYILRDGKEPGQGVGYLEDGTMIVVEGGKRHIGETVEVEVTSVLQTAAGRMIFARPRVAAEARLGARA